MAQRRPTVALFDRPRPIWEEKGNVRAFKTTKKRVDVPNVLTSMRLILVYDFCLWLFVFCLLSAIFCFVLHHLVACCCCPKERRRRQ